MASVAGIFALTRFSPYTGLAVFVGTGMMMTCAWSAPRLLFRLWIERRNYRARAAAGLGEPVLLYGSGRRAEQFIRTNAETQRYAILGFLHEDARLRGRRIRGVLSKGSLANLDSVLAGFRMTGIAPQRLIVTEDGERPDELAAALEAAAVCGLRLARLPSILGLVERGAGDVLRPVSIEDILHRDPIRLDAGAVSAAIGGRTVLVTGAGGSIGSELVRQIAGCSPARIVLLESCEFNLYAIDAEFDRAFPRVQRKMALCDVRDRAALARVFACERPDIVLHAAALKHVPMLEGHPSEAVLTNIQGTRNVAELSRSHGVEIMTLVSTDKAVNPTSVMGCTKRWAEMLCQALDADCGGGPTRFVCVRFGNVLDSAGSVVPLFRKQIAEGGPLTVTHPDVTRYFMTIPEACELILFATTNTLAQQPEDGAVYVLDMGEPVSIVSLAERMIQLHGLRPNVDIAIQITGLRPGEKLYEELAHSAEALKPAGFPKASLARPRAPALDLLIDATDAICAAARAGDTDAVLASLTMMVPEYAGPPLTRRAGSDAA
ncbi:nucleoside-diphosphate sugar epimerase/dehydratase [Sphingomonas sp. 1P06PA]|uniref:polysaccharide biosynthesis protein n=1 Tax=Sphingomonas sp. 1P06PA TaxID=554121 RepID=UPI0039A5B68B